MERLFLSREIIIRNHLAPLPWEQRVVGSNPATPTILSFGFSPSRRINFCPQSVTWVYPCSLLAEKLPRRYDENPRLNFGRSVWPDLTSALT